MIPIIIKDIDGYGLNFAFFNFLYEIVVDYGNIFFLLVGSDVPCSIRSGAFLLLHLQLEDLFPLETLGAV